MSNSGSTQKIIIMVKFKACNQTKQLIKRLSLLILLKMEEKHLTMEELAIQCDMTYRGLQKIVYLEVNDIKLSTFISICQNADIDYSIVLKDIL